MKVREHRIAISSLVVVAAGLVLCQLAVAMFMKDSEKPGFTMPPLKNPRIVIRKSESRLELFDGSTLVKTYPVVFGFTPAGDKEKEGDGKTPEGEFYIFTKPGYQLPVPRRCRPRTCQRSYQQVTARRDRESYK